LDGLRSQCASCHNRKTRIVEQLGEELTVKGCDINATRSTRTILGIEVDQNPTHRSVAKAPPARMAGAARSAGLRLPGAVVTARLPRPTPERLLPAAACAI
jgi:hypothetical protein